VARDRKRAKQRQQRRSGARSSAGRAAERDERAAEHGAGAGRAADGDGIAEGAPSHLTRGDLPGSLDHVGDVDEFDAALVRGAHGVPAPLEDAPTVPAEGLQEIDANGADPEAAELLPAAAGGGDRGRGGNGLALDLPGDGAEAAPPSLPSERRQPAPRRAISFLRASWAELQRVQWPNRSQVSQATAVVLGFVAIAGIYLGAADWVAQKIVNFVL
jgi:preprotein translocase subunit SecE